MNVLVALAPEEFEALEDYWTDQIGNGDEPRAERAIERINELQRVRNDPYGMFKADAD